MRRGKIVICLFTALFLAVIVFARSVEIQWDGNVSLSALVSSQGETEEIDCWKRNSEEYVVFLPSYADLSQVQILTNSRYPVHLDGRLLTDGSSCDPFRLEVPYDLTYTVGGETHHFTLTFLQSGNLPALYIDVSSGSMDYIHTEKGNEESGSLRIYTPEGQLDHAGRLQSVDTRGNSTWGRPQKPYDLTLSEDGDLLGMGQAKNWILLADSYDPSHLRNKIVYDFAKKVGLAYSPDCEWVDLYLNGEYAGLYLLCERNEIHPQRVAVAEEDSFLVSKEWEWRMTEQDQPFVMLDSRASFRIHQSDLSQDALTRTLQSVENAILADDGVDPLTGKALTELIDLDSWCKKYLVEEIFGNSDASTLSQYFYYDGRETGKLYAGPVWDFDISMGNTAAWTRYAPNMFFANKPNVYGTVWFYTLYRNDVFYSRMTELYRTEFLPQLEELLENGLDQYAETISRSAAMNQVRWSERDAAAETEVIRSYMDARMAFLNEAWLEDTQYYTVALNVGDSASSAYYAVHPGESLPELPAFEDTETVIYHGWYDYDTDQPFDVTQPIQKDTVLYLKQSSVPAEPEPVSPEEETVPLRKFAAFGALLGLLVCLFLVDRSQRKRDDTQKNGRTEYHEISS